jgi:hypothetical protein
MLAEILEALHLIGMNSEEKTADRNTALIFLAKFAEGEGGDDSKFAAKLTPKEAQMIARLGVAGTNRRKLGDGAGSTERWSYEVEQARSSPSDGVARGDVSSNGEEGQRVASPGAANQEGAGSTEGPG